MRWAVLQPHPCLADHAQRPLRADDELREVVRLATAREPVEPVAPRLPPEARVVAEDRRAVSLDDPGQFPVDGALERRETRATVPLLHAHRLEPRAPAVGQHNAECPHVITRRAEANRVCSRRVVADHAAEGGAVARRCVGSKHQAVRLDRAVEVVLHDPRLHTRSHRGGIDINDPVHVA